MELRGIPQLQWNEKVGVEMTRDGRHAASGADARRATRACLNAEVSPRLSQNACRLSNLLQKGGVE